MSKRRRFEASTLLLLSPWIVSLLLFGLYPFGFSFVLSFYDYSPLNPKAAKFLGLANYGEALRDPLFWTALKNTLVFVFGTIPFTTLLALGLALALQKRFRGRDFFRAGFFLPTVVSIVVISLVWKGLYAPDGFCRRSCARSAARRRAGCSSRRPRCLRSWRWTCGRRAATTW